MYIYDKMNLALIMFNTFVYFLFIEIEKSLSVLFTDQKDEGIMPPILDPDVSIVTKLEDHEQMPSEQLKSPIVTLIQSGDKDQFGDIYADCFHGNRHPRPSNSSSVKCVYFKLMTGRSLHQACPVVQKQNLSEKEQNASGKISTPVLKVDATSGTEPKTSKSNIVVINSASEVKDEQSVKISEKVVEHSSEASAVESSHGMTSDLPSASLAVEVPSNSAAEITIDEESHVPVEKVTEKTEVPIEIQPSKTVQQVFESTIRTEDAEDKIVQGSSVKSSSQEEITLKPSSSSGVVVPDELPSKQETPALTLPSTETIEDRKSSSDTADSSSIKDIADDKSTIGDTPIVSTF